MKTIDSNQFAPVGRMLARRAEAARLRRDAKRLSAMPDYLLRDIGLHRGEIANICAARPDALACRTGRQACGRRPEAPIFHPSPFRRVHFPNQGY